MRQRVIFVGVRNDLGLQPAHPKPLPYRYSVREAIPWITTIGSSKGFGHSEQVPSDRPYHTVATAPQQGNGLARFVEAYVQTAKGNRSIDDPAPSVLTHGRQHTTSELTVTHRAYLDKRGAFGNDGDITDQPAPAVLADSVGTHWMVESESSMEGYAVGAEWDTLRPGEKSDKYQSLVKPSLDKPSPTVTQRGGDNTAASVTHPTEKRKFSITELKRICAFPDDFILTGTYAQQWERLGRAVPPVMMEKIAIAIRDEVLAKCAE